MKVELLKMKITYTIHSCGKVMEENIIISKYVKICNEIAKGEAINPSYWRK